MDVWGEYTQRLNVHGNTKREAMKKRETRHIYHRLPDNLSYQDVEIYLDEYGYNIDSDEMKKHMIEQNVAIIDSDNLNEKYIYSLPDEDIVLGSLIHWMDNYWIVEERDANTTLYTRAKLIQCNHLLKWINADKQIIEQWCVVEDGTKLEHIHDVCYSLAYWKQCVKTILLIAGKNSLKPYIPQRNGEINVGAMVAKAERNIWMTHEQKSKRHYNGRSAAKSRTGKGSTAIPKAGVGTSVPKWRTPKSFTMIW